MNQFLHDVLNGLQQPQKQIAPKYFYDAQGSALFDQICQLDAYYPYRTELALLPDVARDLNTFFAHKDVAPLRIIEFGAGSLHKIEPLLTSITAIKELVAIDISGEHLASACASLRIRYPNIRITPVQSDFTRQVALDASLALSVGFFPGSTIGNFTPDEANRFLTEARHTLGSGSYMLIGLDTQKDRAKLNAAYNDKEGITAAFNKNLLARINRELNANFDLAQFQHEAFYNEDKGRIEMHLRSCCDQLVKIDGTPVKFRRNETIHTENSYKFLPDGFEALTEKAGWRTVRWWMAPDDLFAMTLLHC